jgi:DNA-binding transcriptional MocR family regulator
MICGASKSCAEALRTSSRARIARSDDMIIDMTIHCDRVAGPKRLHDLVIRQLATQITESNQSAGSLTFPNEAQLCRELGVSRSILRESMKVLADKGMVEMGPRVGTRARPRSDWRWLDPDVPSALIRSDPLCCAQHNGSYVEFRIMLSQGPRSGSDAAPIRFRLKELSIITRP